MNQLGFDSLSGENLGSVLISFSIGLVLFGIVVTQAHTYYLSYPNDKISLKFLATSILVLEVVHSISTLYTMYYNLIVRRGQSPNGPNSYPLVVTVIPGTLVTTLVQFFFSFRIYRLSRTIYIYVICLLLILLHLGGNTLLIIEAFIDVPRIPNTVTFITKYGWVIALNATSGAVADVITTAALCYYLKRLAPGEQPASTSQLVNSLLLWAIRTGMITSLVSIGTVISYFVKPHAEIWYAVYIVLTKLYSNSFFVSLNIRRQLREDHAPEINVSLIQFRNKTTMHENISSEVRSIAYPT